MSNLLKLLILLSCLLATACIIFKKLPNEILNQGQQLAFTRTKGNCLACHIIEDGKFPGNLGPELKNIKHRFKTQVQLRQFIWDATLFNAKTAMPPFGKNKILSEQEIDILVNYLWQL